MLLESLYKHWKEQRILNKPFVLLPFKCNAKKTLHQAHLFFKKQESLLVNEIKSFQYKETEAPKKTLISLDNKQSRVGDWLGNVFEYNGKYLRKIKDESKPLFYKLWEMGLFQILSKFKFIPPVRISQFYTNDCDLILETDYVNLRKFNEWSYDECVSACIFVSLLQRVLANFDCFLQDPHYYNFFISNGRPIYLDLGSFCPKESSNNSLNEYSLVFTLCYRLLFFCFPNSILKSREIETKTIWGNKDLNTNMIEYIYFKRQFIKYLKRHCKMTEIHAATRVFDNFSVSPEDIYLLFSNNDFSDYIFVAEEDIND